MWQMHTSEIQVKQLNESPPSFACRTASNVSGRATLICLMNSLVKNEDRQWREERGSTKGKERQRKGNGKKKKRLAQVEGDPLLHHMCRSISLSSCMVANAQFHQSNQLHKLTHNMQRWESRGKRKKTTNLQWNFQGSLWVLSLLCDLTTSSITQPWMNHPNAIICTWKIWRSPPMAVLGPKVTKPWSKQIVAKRVSHFALCEIIGPWQFKGVQI